MWKYEVSSFCWGLVVEFVELTGLFAKELSRMSVSSSDTTLIAERCKRISMRTKRTAAIAKGHACNIRLSKYSGISPTLVRATKLPNLIQPDKKKNSAIMTAKTVAIAALYKNAA